jgi:phosphohistidine phosphatase SixA
MWGRRTHCGYVLLCGHGSHRSGTLERAKRDKDEPGAYPVEGVAERLREQLMLQREMRLTRVVVADTPESRQTARALLDVLAYDTPSWADNPDSQVPSELPPDPKVTAPSWAKAQLKRDGVALEQRVECDLLRALSPAFSGAGGALDAVESRIRDALSAQPSNTQDPSNTQEPSNTQVSAEPSNPQLPGVLIIGHNPQLGWLSNRLHSTRVPAWCQPWRRWLLAGVPVRSSEVVCIAVRPTGQQDGYQAPAGQPAGADAPTQDPEPASHTEDPRLPRAWNGYLVWQIVPDDKEAYEDVREKIRSKMETAKLLSAVITLVLTALLAVLLDAGKWGALNKAGAELLGIHALRYGGQAAAKVAFVLLLAALGLFMATMYAYDRLLMPSRFWVERPQLSGRDPRGTWLPHRPPGSSAWVIFRNMQRVWFALFTPATLLVAAALVVLALPLLRLGLTGQLLLASAAVAYIVLVHWFRPVLGSED